MDHPKVVSLVAKKLGGRVKLEDPMLDIVPMMEAINTAATDQMLSVVSDATKQISEMLVLADRNAQGRSEKIIRDATQSSAEKIRLAGVDAAASVAKVLEETVDRCEAAARTAVITAWISSGAAAICVVIVGLVIGKVIPIP